jgi:hypothetical protein
MRYLLLRILFHLLYHRHRAKPLRLAAVFETGDGNSITVEDSVDILIHQGGQQKLQLKPETKGGKVIDFAGSETEIVADPSLVTVAHNPADKSQIAIAAVGDNVGQTVVTVTYTNPDGVTATLSIFVTVAAPDATVLDASAIGDEEPAGTPFPPPKPPAAAPTVTGLSPDTGSGGQAVTISGSGFEQVSSVMFGDQPAAGFEVADATTINATAPVSAAPGTVDVVVTTPAGASELDHESQFTFT